MKELAAFLAEHRAKIEPLEVEMGDAWWQTNLTGTAESSDRAAVAQKEIARIYADRNGYQYLHNLPTGTLTADETRQRNLLLNAFTGNQMDEATIDELVDLERCVELAYNNHRPILRGEPAPDNRIKDILRESNDSSLRYEAWEASKEIGIKVERDIRRMVAIRNREAQRLGFPDYYQMALTLQELDRDELFTLLDDLESRTTALYTAYKGALDHSLAAKFEIPVDKLQAWHYGDPFFQEAPSGEVDLDRFFKDKNLEEMTVAFYDAIGLEIRDILGRSDLYEREGKSQHAFCLHVGRFEDVRVLCNITGSERWMGTTLHEFGHAVYDKYLGDDLPYFLRDTAHTLTTEAIAMLMGRLSRNAAWLVKYAGVAPEEAARVAASADAEQRAQLLILTRWCLVMAHFERALYEQPDADLNRLWWELVERFQGVKMPKGRNCPDWAAKLHIALAPVYYQNYLLGEMFASQLYDYLREHVLPQGAGDTGLITNPAVGAYLTKAIFAPGARLRWDELIENATGEPLNSTHYVAHLSH